RYQDRCWLVCWAVPCVADSHYWGDRFSCCAWADPDRGGQTCGWYWRDYHHFWCADQSFCFAHKPYWAYHHHNRITRWSFHLPMENQRGVPEFLHHRMGSYQNRCRVGLGKRAQTSVPGYRRYSGLVVGKRHTTNFWILC